MSPRNTDWISSTSSSTQSPSLSWTSMYTQTSVVKTQCFAFSRLFYRITQFSIYVFSKLCDRCPSVFPAVGSRPEYSCTVFRVAFHPSLILSAMSPLLVYLVLLGSRPKRHQSRLCNFAASLLFPLSKASRASTASTIRSPSSTVSRKKLRASANHSGKCAK